MNKPVQRDGQTDIRDLIILPRIEVYMFHAAGKGVKSVKIPSDQVLITYYKVLRRIRIVSSKLQ